jgi:hypothetical protein
MSSYNWIRYIPIVLFFGFGSPLALADQREFAEDLAAALCGAIGADIGGNTAAAAGSVVCKYTTRATDSAVRALIDTYFDRNDQKFADATCSRIVYANGKVITPSTASGCKQN